MAFKSKSPKGFQYGKTVLNNYHDLAGALKSLSGAQSQRVNTIRALRRNTEEEAEMTPFKRKNIGKGY